MNISEFQIISLYSIKSGGYFSTIPPPFFYSRTLRVYVFSNAWSRDSEYTSCKHSVCHELYPSPWRGNQGTLFHNSPTSCWLSQHIQVSMFIHM